MLDALTLGAVLNSELAQSLLRIHPNDVVADKNFLPPNAWQSWWHWAASARQPWITAANLFAGSDHKLDVQTDVQNTDVPTSLRDFIDVIRHCQLARDPIHINSHLSVPSNKGLSPKKAHEVSRMATYVVRLIRANGLDPATVRIVDVGAGQGYLTRTLKYHLPDTHILALDADEGQTVGAQRWEERILKDVDSNPITHRTILISPRTLVEVIDDWVQGTQPSADKNPVPVFVVALHACGSLTPDILRAFIFSRNSKRCLWSPLGVVAVGCCYNLMNPADFPLSQEVLAHPPLHLPISAYHLAAQIPTHWLDNATSKPLPTVTLAMRKVSWRALLNRELLQRFDTLPEEEEAEKENRNEKPQPPSRRPRHPVAQVPKAVTEGTGTTPVLRRLGRLRDGAYADWQGFLCTAGQRMGVDLVGGEDVQGKPDKILEQRLELLHALRCMLGPSVESLILLDRLAWVMEALKSNSGNTRKMEARLVNLFDQATGSGRNVAIVVAPEIPSYI